MIRDVRKRIMVCILCAYLIALIIVARTTYIMVFDRSYWLEVSQQYKRDSIVDRPQRGNILAANGDLLVGDLPRYKLYIDFMVQPERNESEQQKRCREKEQRERDALLQTRLDTICQELHKIFPDRSKAQWADHIRAGRKKESRYWLLYPKRVTYSQMRAVKALPVLGKLPNKGGINAECYPARCKIYGDLASVTIGNLFASKDTAYNGIELAFDSLLRGIPGLKHQQKVLNRNLNLFDIPSVPGCNVVTTLDMEIQDIAHKALLDEVKKIGAETGVAIVMEVATGDVRAMVNLQRTAQEQYSEVVNHAISDLMEPGSVMKTASLMVALDDGKITLADSVDVGNGVKMLHGKKLTDHNFRSGGYKRALSVTEILMYSSNIGVAELIERGYGANRETMTQFVQGLHRVGITQPLGLQLYGEAVPYIRQPHEKYWSKTSLSRLSIGYESQIPPIHVLTFYNAIANGGRMVKPRFVTEVRNNDKVIARYPVEVLKKSICKSSTLRDVQHMLRAVVRDGLGKTAGSVHFDVSGKTGTALVSTGGGYQSGTMYLVSFCGYFPSEAPLYSCIVVIKVRTASPSGGGMSGAVFHEIAERIYARSAMESMTKAVDTIHAHYPKLMKGFPENTHKVLRALHLSTDSIAPWQQPEMDRVPNVKGMGANDALFLLEERGLHVCLNGVGSVVSQSIPPGNKVRKGDNITITLK